MNKIIAVDIETSGLSWQNDTIHGIAVAYEEDEYEYVLLKDFKKSKLKTVLADASVTKIFHNAGFDVKFLRKAGINVRGTVVDSLVMAQLVDENSSLKLKDLAVRYLGEDAIQHARAIYKWLTDNNLTKDSLASAPPELVAAYACEDVNNTFKLYHLFDQKIAQLSDKMTNILGVKRTVKDYLIDEAIPIEPILWDMEYSGVSIDMSKIEAARKILEKEQEDYLKQMSEIAREEIDAQMEVAYQKDLAKRVTEKGKSKVKRPEFSWGSSKQVGTLLFEGLGLENFFKSTTEKGQWKCSDDIVKKALKIRDLPTKLQQFLSVYVNYTKTMKKLSTYIGDADSGLLSHITNGKIHASYKQAGEGRALHEAAGTGTGRLSSANPNLQNLAPFAREFFRPEPGHVFLHFDYSQIELRLAAHFSKDPVFLDAYNTGGDLHRETASAIFDMAPEDIDKAKRQIGKTVNFLLIYNGSAGKLRQQLEISPPKGPGLVISIEEARHFRDAFFDKYNVFRAYLESQKQFMCKYLIVLSPFGRIRRLPELKYNNGIDNYRRLYKGPYESELKALIAKLPPGTKNFYGEPFTTYDMAKKKISHAFNQGYNFPNQSAAASIAKRAMIKLNALGYKIVNQVHDSVDIMIKNDKNIDKHVEVCKNVLESVVRLRVPLVVEHKILKSFSEEDTL